MSEIWVTSDTHFFHDNIIKYCGRPFSNALEMNDYMVEKWNATVKPQDKVYHLGDVYMGGGNTRDSISALLRSLNGKKRLILGNHDNGKDQLLQNNFQKIEVWRMFTEFGLLLTHVPVHHSSLFRGPSGNEKDPPKLLNIHGHIHEKVVTKLRPADTFYEAKVVEDGDYKCVCVEHLDYGLVNIEELRKW